MSASITSSATITINAPTSKIWTALTDPALIKEYLFGSDVVTDWQEGSPVIYKGTYQGKEFEDKGRIVMVIPEKLLVMTHWSPLSGTPDTPENYHTVTYMLEPSEKVVQVTISQDNNSSEEEKVQTSQFWMTVLEGLKKIVE